MSNRAYGNMHIHLSTMLIFVLCLLMIQAVSEGGSDHEYDRATDTGGQPGTHTIHLTGTGMLAQRAPAADFLHTEIHYDSRAGCTVVGVGLGGIDAPSSSPSAQLLGFDYCKLGTGHDADWNITGERYVYGPSESSIHFGAHYSYLYSDRWCGDGWYRPDNSLYFEEKYHHQIPHPNDYGYDYWEWYNVAFWYDPMPSSMQSVEGQWTAKWYDDGSNACSKGYTVMYILSDHKMCAEISGLDPSDIRNAFSYDEPQACCWLRLDNFTYNWTNDIKWRWYGPEGFYTEAEYDADNPGAGSWWEWYKAWACMYISGHYPCTHPGDWHVDVYVKDYSNVYEHKFTEYFTIACPDPLSPPSLQVPPNDAVCQPTSISFDWSDVSGAVQYQLRVGESCGTGNTYETSSSHYTVGNLRSGTTYYWQVRVKDDCEQWGDWSSCYNLTVSPGTCTPSLVSPPDEAADQPTPVELCWNACPGTQQYEVTIGSICGSGDVYSSVGTCKSVSGLDEGTTYYWQVRAQTICGSWGIWSGCRSFTTEATEQCDVAPTQLTFSVESIGETDSKTFTVTNAGGTTLSGSVSEGCGEFTLSPDEPYSLAPGESKQYTAMYAPIDCGDDACVIQITAPCSGISCEGNGPPPIPLCEVMPTNLSLTCDEVGCTDTEVFTIRNTGCGTLSGTIQAACPELSVLPSSYSLMHGQSETFTVTLTCSGPGEGSCIIGTGVDCDDVVCQWSCHPCQDIALGTGWNCVSTRVLPDTPWMGDVWARHISEGNLNIVKNNCTGEFCIPGVYCPPEFSWNPLSGYLAHLNAPDVLSVCGAGVPIEDPIHLEAGWNCVSFFPQELQSPQEALALCWEFIDIVKSSCTGEFCIPGIYCGIASMNPGEGYMIHMSQPCDLYYPALSVMTITNPAGPDRIRSGQHFACPRGTGASYSLMVWIEEGLLETSDEIGVFSGNLCVGSAEWVEGQIIGITAWGDDVMTDIVDGCKEGDDLTFRMWDASKGEETDLFASYAMGNGTYGNEPFAAVHVSSIIDRAGTDAEAKHVDLLMQNRPNPFSEQSKILYDLASGGHIVIRVYNIQGRCIRELVNEARPAGPHEVIWDGRDDAGRDVGTGIYFYRIEGEHCRATNKMMLIR